MKRFRYILKRLKDKLIDAVCEKLYGLRKFEFDDGVFIVRAKFAELFTDRVPWKLYTWYPNPRESGLYIHYAREDVTIGKVEHRHIIVHNIFAWKRAMEFWGADIIEWIILEDLHELTHWAMSEEDRIYWKSLDEKGKDHSYSWNPFLLDLIREFRK